MSRITPLAACPRRPLPERPQASALAERPPLARLTTPAPWPAHTDPPPGAPEDTIDALQHEGELGGRVDREALCREVGYHERGQPNPVAAAYHSYEQVGQELAELERRYPAIAERVSLGRTHEGREIWALKVSGGVRCSDTSGKPGVVLTGCHHAREWMSLEAPLEVAHQLLEGYAADPEMKRRVDGAEIWVVPLVNPDGYEYSRTQDNLWKKNRRPVGNTACGEATHAVGTDLNRNYLSPLPQDFHLYRPPGDTPCSTADDFSHTSDDPHANDYRGPYGASEPEVQALLRLELGRGNIRGVLDHHGFGEMVLYPWGHSPEAPPGAERLRALGERLSGAIAAEGAEPFRVMQSASLYPCSGSSDDVLYSNGILNYTLEVGRSYQPAADQIEPVCRSVARANLLFIDEVMGAPGGSLKRIGTGQTATRPRVAAESRCLADLLTVPRFPTDPD